MVPSHPLQLSPLSIMRNPNPLRRKRGVSFSSSESIKKLILPEAQISTIIAHS